MKIKNKRIGYVPPALRDIVRPKIDYSLLYKRPKDWNYGST